VLDNVKINPVIYELLSLKTLLIVATTVGYAIAKNSPVTHIKMRALCPTIRAIINNTHAISKEYKTDCKYPNFSATNPPNNLPIVSKKKKADKNIAPLLLV